MPSNDYNQRVSNTTFFSPISQRHHGLLHLPPSGYLEADLASQRYPVLYLMHGYGEL